MMNGGDLYELAKLLGHSNIKMTERYAKLAKHHIAWTGNTAREMWELWNQKRGTGRNRQGLDVPILFPRASTVRSWLLLSVLECGGQGRLPTAFDVPSDPTDRPVP
jgi:hypothetical protein